MLFSALGFRQTGEIGPMCTWRRARGKATKQGHLETLGRLPLAFASAAPSSALRLAMRN